MMILSHLDEYYGHKTGSHWNDIRKIKEEKVFFANIWKQLPNLLEIFTKTSEDMSIPFEEIKERVDDLLNEKS